MQGQRRANVAILLPTYNGAQFVEAQIQSLKENETLFTLHWLDDHSTDNTRALVRACARKFGIELCEWHQLQHQGCPGAFFQLLECVDADTYLFCDQDDIWQPGKIDATVLNLLPDIVAPALCYSHSLLFESSNPAKLRPTYEALFGTSMNLPLRESQIFLWNPAQGNTIGFTRPLREIFLAHKDIARTYASTHDSWLHMIAAACGLSRLLLNVPTALYRIHGNNASADLMVGNGIRSAALHWRFLHTMRRWWSRQAEGFCLAASCLPQQPRVQRLLEIAKIVSNIDRRQSARIVTHLARLGALPPSRPLSISLAAAFLCCDASGDYEFRAH